MAFMKPFAEFFTSGEQTNELPAPRMCNGCGRESRFYSMIAETNEQMLCTRCIPAEPGWFSRLSAPGYMDSTGWQGPYETEEAALKAVMDQYEVDENGDDLTD